MNHGSIIRPVVHFQGKIIRLLLKVDLLMSKTPSFVEKAIVYYVE